MKCTEAREELVALAKEYEILASYVASSRLDRSVSVFAMQVAELGHNERNSSLACRSPDRSSSARTASRSSAAAGSTGDMSRIRME
jgi:hypothetical protein